MTVATFAILLVPRLLGLGTALVFRPSRRAHGGAPRAAASAVFETCLAALLAPVLMLHHARMVLAIALGQAVRWGSSRAAVRHEASGAVAIARHELATTIIGLGTFAGVHALAPSLVVWLAPVFVPWVLSIPLALAVSSRRVGRWVARIGLLAERTECEPDALAARVDELRVLTASDDSARFRDLVLDPILLEAHVARLGGRRGSDSRAELDQMLARALRLGPAGLSALERKTLAGDAGAMRTLHRDAWRNWPVETWELRRDLPQLPSP
jgi:membrane glycosyltransferase